LTCKSSDRKKKKEKGSIAVLVAASLTVLLGLSAFVTDLGILYVHKTRLQSALDAAVLAGAQDLLQGTTLAQQTAVQYAATNGVPEITVSFSANNKKITASAQETVPTFFAKIMGIDENTVSASAAAVNVPPNGMKNLVPFGFLEQDMNYETLYNLKVGSNSSDVLDQSGWFGPLDFTVPDYLTYLGGGANTYSYFIKHGYPEPIRLGQTVHVEHGNISGPTKSAIEERLLNPDNAYVYIPIVNIIENNGVSIINVVVVGFAAFHIEGVTRNGNDSYVRGHFVEMLVLDGQESGSNADLQDSLEDLENGTVDNDFGLYAVKLVS
jgi:hypothetical protein